MNVGLINFKFKYNVKTPYREEWERMKINIQPFSNSTRDDGDKSAARSISYSCLKEKPHSNKKDCLGW
jgi:hypothetical protein